MKIKAIETIYKNHRFRSRTEARYAVFFDAMGMPWQYELEGYDLGNGIYYLPDFYLPEAKQFFEVKGLLSEISEEDLIKVKRLSSLTGKYVTIGDSNFNYMGCESEFGFDVGSTYLVRCLTCGALYFENEMSFECTACGDYDGDNTFDYESSYDQRDYSKQYKDALFKAMSARFEHGEKG